jgi:hypothetical protein
MIEKSKRLEKILVRRSDMTGTIPEFVGEFANLTHLQLDGVKFTGSLPLSVFGLKKLISLSLGGPKIELQLPTQLGDLTSLCKCI